MMVERSEMFRFALRFGKSGVVEYFYSHRDGLSRASGESETLRQTPKSFTLKSSLLFGGANIMRSQVLPGLLALRLTAPSSTEFPTISVAQSIPTGTKMILKTGKDAVENTNSDRQLKWLLFRLALLLAE